MLHLVYESKLPNTGLLLAVLASRAFPLSFRVPAGILHGSRAVGRLRPETIEHCIAGADQTQIRYDATHYLQALSSRAPCPSFPFFI